MSESLTVELPDDVWSWACQRASAAGVSLERFVSACEAAKYHLQVNLREGYDHSYFFISTFIENHLRFHAEALGHP